MARKLFTVFQILVALALSASAVLFALPQKSEAALTDGLVGHWTFDGADVTDKVYDRSGWGNHAYFEGGATSSAKVIGKLGQALSFDGADDAVNAGSPTSLTNLSRLTACAWIYVLPANGGGVPIIINKSVGGSGGWYLSVLEPGLGNGFSFYSGLADTIEYTSALVTKNVWHHVCATWDGSDGTSGMVLYFNGNSVTPTNTTPSSDPIEDSAYNLYIGWTSGGNEFTGNIDDARVYNRALSAAEVRQLYNYGQALKKPPNNLGLVGYWSFDEGTGTKATDFSGRGNTGTLTGSPSWINGKRGRALNFNGSTAYVDMGTPTGLDMDGAMTACSWFNAETLPADSSVVGNNDSGTTNAQYNIALVSNGRVSFYWENASSYEQYDSATGLIVPGRWYHVCGVRDVSAVGTLYVNALSVGTPSGDVAAPNSAGNAVIGRLGSVNYAYFDGTIDEVRMYNRALSSTEVAALAKTGAVKFTSSVELQRGSTLANGLVGHWTFDGPDVTPNLIVDRSGQGNNGGFIGGATSSAKVIGKLGQALTFVSANNQYVATSDVASLRLAGSYTLSTWVKLTSLPGNGNQFSMIARSNASDYDNYRLILDNGSVAAGLGWVVYYAENGGSGHYAKYTAPVSTGTWYHVVGVWDAVAQKLYVYLDGSLQASSDQTTVPASQAGTGVIMGRQSCCGGGNNLNGIEDDVRVYNRALTPAEVKQLFQLGTTKIVQ